MAFAEDEDYEVVVAVAVVALGAFLVAVVPDDNLARTRADTAVAVGVKQRIRYLSVVMWYC